MVAGAHEGRREKRGGLVERVQRGEGAETALTGLGSAGIRALQILFVREPAAGIASEGSSARYSALPSMLAAPFRLRSGLPVKCAGSRGGCKRGWRVAWMVRTNRWQTDKWPHTTASDEKTFNLSISDDPSWPQENISLWSSRQCERSSSVDRPDDLGKLRDSLISFVSRW